MNSKSKWQKIAINLFSNRLNIGCTLDSSGSFLSLDQNNVYCKDLIIDIDSEIIEIPVIAKYFFELAAEQTILEENPYNTQKIILPLFSNCMPKNVKAFANIFCLANDVTFNERLKRVITPKGDEYYVGRGLILDKNMNPLLMCTSAAKRGKDLHDVSTFDYIKPICHIDPRVFDSTNSSKPVEKGIISKLIPFYSQNQIVTYPYAGNYGRFRSLNNDWKCKIIIDSLDKFFINPTKPSPAKCSHEALNDCLVNNIEDILQEVR